MQRFLPAVCSNVIARKGVTDIKSLQIAGEFFGFRLNQYIGNFFPGIQNLVQILVVINCGADAFGSCGILGFSRIDIFFESVDAWVPEAVMETPLDFL